MYVTKSINNAKYTIKNYNLEIIIWNIHVYSFPPRIKMQIQ